MNNDECYTEAEFQQAYVKFLLELHDVESDGIDLGRYPTIDEFRVIFEEEYECSKLG